MDARELRGRRRRLRAEKERIKRSKEPRRELMLRRAQQRPGDSEAQLAALVVQTQDELELLERRLDNLEDVLLGRLSGDPPLPGDA